MVANGQQIHRRVGTDNGIEHQVVTMQVLTQSVCSTCWQRAKLGQRLSGLGWVDQIGAAHAREAP